MRMPTAAWCCAVSVACARAAVLAFARARRPRRAETFPKRFVYVSISCGEQGYNWWPQHSFSFTDNPGMVREAPLSSVAGKGGLNKVIGPEFDPFLDKLLFLRGLGLIGPALGGHNPSAPMSGSRQRTGRADDRPASGLLRRGLSDPPPCARCT